MKTWIIAAAIGVLLVVVLAGYAFVQYLLPGAGAIGVIGSADGPTSVFIASQAARYGVLALIAGIAVGAVLWARRKK